MPDPQNGPASEPQQPPYPQTPPVYGLPPVGTPHSGQTPPGAQPGYAQHAPHPGYAQQQFPSPKRGLPVGAIIGIIVGAIALLVVVIALALAALFAIRGSGEPSRSEVNAAGEQLVREYLEAVAAGDAQQALSYLDDDFADGDALLTDEMLAASLRLAPITGITVEATDAPYSGSAYVRASYLVGDERVEQVYSVWRTAGEWKLYDGLVRVDFDRWVDLGLTVNGIAVDDETIAGTAYLFPGGYTLAFDDEHLSLGSDETRIHVFGAQERAEIDDLEIELTEHGAQVFRSLVRASLDACMAETTLESSCGLDFVELDTENPADYVDGTVQRALNADGSVALDALEIETDWRSSGSFRTTTFIGVRATAELVEGGTRTKPSLWFLSYPVVDFRGGEPVVEWRRL